ncbi:hypothetical protein BDR26DRAFT_139924 [Obelidium mucronatum]|nr:hypothetical protein BDR26DRAFT_139924 [Obelidium mucronatum]
MDPLSLVPQHIRLLAKKRPPRQDDKSDNLSSALTQSWQLPYSQHEEFALVAIIDISGYSKLSSYLQEVLGSDSGAKVKELLNKPINAIIKHVHMSGGSVVKFAGDAVIAMWSVPSTSQEIRETTVRRVFTSCLQLMIFFKNYELVVPLKQAGQTGTTSSASSTRTDGRRNSVDATNDRRRSSSVITEALEKQTKKQPLKIHIGLGIGEMQHVHIGDDVSKTGSADGLFPRSEYFIAGKSLKNSGILLGLGKPGDFTFDSIGHDFVIGAMTAEPSFPPVRKGSRELGGRYFMVTETDPIDKYLLCLNQALQAQPDLNSDSEGTLISSKERDSGFINTIVPYIDDALAQSVRVVEPVSSSEELDGESPFSVDLGNYDQLRGVAVLFLYFPAFNVDTVAQPDNLSKLQKITVVILAAIRKHQGCLRQFNCDDKSLTALLVWGLEGFAHEKSECYFSMAAAMDMIPQLGEIIGNYFAIGATKGTVFAGIIGNQNRCDGTLLGVCVNNAARLMCLDRCMGGILCDEDTYKDTSDTIEYDTDIPEVILKGVPNPVKVYSPLQRNQAQKVAKAKVIIEGRENEIKEISEVITSWITESKRRLLIAGRSGTGKSILLQHIEEKVKEIPRSILCVGKCQENHQNTLLSAYTHVVNELASNIRSQHVKTRDLFVLMQQEANASRSSLCADTISGRTSIQSRGNKSKSMTKVETVEVFGKVSATDIANLPGLVRQASNKKAPPETTEESKKLKGGEHRKSSPNTLVQTEALLPEPFELSKLKRSPSLTRQDSVTSTNDQLKVPKRQLTKGGSSRSIGKEDIKKVGHRQAISIEPKSNNAKLDNLLTAATSLSNISAACGVEIFSPATNTTSIKASVDNIQDLTLAELMATLFTGPECDTLNAIPALNLSSNNQVVTQEILPRIALLFAKLFEALASVGHRVCIIFDDLQWCDAYSLELTLCLMQKCNNVLFVGLKRPIEEWKESRIPMLLKIKSNTTNYIGLSNLDRLAIEAIIKQLSILNPTSVSKELTDEIFNRSQGNPLVAQVLIRILNDDVNVALADGVLVRRGDKNSATLPSGATAAVVAQ